MAFRSLIGSHVLFTKPLSSSSRRRPLVMASAPVQSSSSSSTTQSVAAGDVNGDTNIYQLIQAHQEKAARLPPIEQVRTVLDRSIRGTLSTFSLKYQGYPSGSMVNFACDVDGSPILAVSSLAVHTKDLLAYLKCSLLVAKDPEDRTDLVITVHGDATLVDFGDFQYMGIKPKIVRFVSGVATALLGSGEFDKEDYKAAKVDLSHMNKDHGEDTKAIVQHSTGVQVDFAYMLNLDSLGFNVKAGYEGNTFKLRIP